MYHKFCKWGWGGGTYVVVLHLDLLLFKGSCIFQKFNSTYLRSNLLNLVNNLCLTRESKKTDFSRSFVLYEF